MAVVQFENRIGGEKAANVGNVKRAREELTKGAERAAEAGESLEGLLDLAATVTGAHFNGGNINCPAVAQSSINLVGTILDEIGLVPDDDLPENKAKLEIYRSFLGFAAVGLVRALQGQPLINFDQAQFWQNQLNAVIPPVLNQYVSNRTQYNLLSKLFTSGQQFITAKGQQTPRVLQAAAQVAKPAFVWAYELYGDATRATELMEQNDETDAMFVGGKGEPLRYLSE